MPISSSITATVSVSSLNMDYTQSGIVYFKKSNIKSPLGKRTSEETLHYLSSQIDSKQQ